MRKTIDILLTLNLLAVTVYLAYLWYSEQLIIIFAPTQTASTIDYTIYTVFAGTLKEEVNRQLGEPEGGYEPAMLLAIFPGLTASDFNGVEASIGQYQIENGLLVHKITEPHMIHEEATAISRRGFDSLLENVARRLHIDLQSTGTLTEIMNAISY